MYLDAHQPIEGCSETFAFSRDGGRPLSDSGVEKTSSSRLMESSTPAISKLLAAIRAIFNARNVGMEQDVGFGF